MSIPRRAAAVALVAVVGTGCSSGPVGQASPDAAASASPVASPAVSVSPGPATASATPATQLDLTAPGAAEALVAALLDAAGATRAVMVTVTGQDASVAVVKDGAAQTWAWREGRIQQVPSDITYVAQRTFDPGDFDFHDVGALFRAAQSVSGSRQGQSLQVVDYSGGLVSMSVSTNPESRAVFFNPDGTLLPTLDFTSLWGLEQGFGDAAGPRGTASAVGFGSALGVYLDSPRDAAGAHQRWHRTARTPVIVTPRNDSSPLPAFDPARVRPAAVWWVLAGLADDGEFTLDGVWSCVVDDRAATGSPRMYFTVADRSFVTDLDGNVLG